MEGVGELLESLLLTVGPDSRETAVFFWGVDVVCSVGSGETKDLG